MYEFFSMIQNYAIPFILVISVIVFIHELGHFLVARACGVRVVSFSIGFGWRLFGWTDKQGTEWKVGILPLGGYVKMYGDADAASTPDEAVKTMTAQEKKVSFHHQPVSKRMAIVAAGPAFNYLFAILILAGLFMFQGQPYTPAEVSFVQENSVAGRAGLMVGDKVVSIDNRQISRFEDIKRVISMNSGTSVPVVVERDGEQRTFVLTPEVTIHTDRFGGEHKLGKIGIGSTKLEYKEWSLFPAIYHATKEAWNISADTLKAVGQIFTGLRGTEELGGPLRIAEMSGNIVQEGVWPLLWFMALISINLGLINLFPVPLLDGGHLLFYSLEAIFRRPLSEKVQEIGFRIGLLLVVSLMVFATWNDLIHLKVVAKIMSLFS